MKNSLKILVIEPFYLGSHKQFLDGLAQHSRHEFKIISGLTTAWKWEMRSAPLTLLESIKNTIENFDLVLCSSYFDLATATGFVEYMHHIPKIIYFHENQWSYPIQEKKKRDYHFAFTQLAAMHCAEASWFNSHWNKQSMAHEIDNFLNRMPRSAKSINSKKIFKKSHVVPLAIDFPDRIPPKNKKSCPVILWNHRWEYDKRPDIFFDALTQLEEANFDFKLILCGQRPTTENIHLKKITENFRKNIIHNGYCTTQNIYHQQLNHADIIISTADQEFFGVSVCEGIFAGCLPFLPNRLSYPEIIHKQFHGECLYEDLNDLVSKILSFDRTTEGSLRRNLKKHIEKFSWEQRIGDYDAKFLDTYKSYRS